MSSELTKNEHQALNETDLEPNRLDLARADRIRQAARRLGSNRALSSKSGVPTSTLSGYLAGGEPKIASLLAISDAAGVSFEWLATGRGLPEIGQSESASPAKAPQAPQAKLFATLDMDRLGEAIETADAAFDQRGASPTPRERAQAVALIYDMLNIRDGAVRSVVPLDPPLNEP